MTIAGIIELATALVGDVEEKVVRHVRTEAGRRKYGEPIGSVIVADRKLANLKGVASDYEGWDKYKGADGADYYVGKSEGGGWSVADPNDEELHHASSQESALGWLDKQAGKGKGSAGTPKTTGKPAATSKGPTRAKLGEQEFEGWDTYHGEDDFTYYVSEGSSPTAQVTDVDGNVLYEGPRSGVAKAIDDMVIPNLPSKPTPPPAPVAKPAASSSTTAKPARKTAGPKKLADAATAKAIVSKYRTLGTESSFSRKIVAGIAHDVQLTPKTGKKLHGIELNKNRRARVGEYHIGPKTFEVATSMEHDPIDRANYLNGYFSRKADTVHPTDSIMSHEYGHHIDAHLTPAQRHQVFVELAKQLNLPPPRGGYTGNMQSRSSPYYDWTKQWKSVLSRSVSGYGSKNQLELLAEIWHEYSRGGDKTRPHIAAVGRLMQQLVEGQ